MDEQQSTEPNKNETEKQAETAAPTNDQNNPAAEATATAEPEKPSIFDQPEPPKPGKSKKFWIIAGIIALLLAAGGGYVWTKIIQQASLSAKDVTILDSTSSTDKLNDSTQTAEGLKLEPTKNYGNKYADGMLPVGDKHYVTDAAKVGYVYECSANFVPESQAGAQTRGPWFSGTTKWNINKKSAVSGKVSWTPSMTVSISGGKRVITTNDLPNHSTGVYPIRSTDPAYAYDRNPSTISAQSLSYSLNASPTYGTPKCMGGEVGVMLTGVALFNAFDAGGRDAGAWEVQDSCDGHPQNKGEYHYHTMSRCITDISVSTVIGYALDGFPITGPKVGTNNILTTSDLDECHGIVSQITLDGKKVTQYHYVLTQDFPYSVSCFRSTAIQPPGQHETTGGQQTSQSGTGQQAPPSDRKQLPPPPQ